MEPNDVTILDFVGALFEDERFVNVEYQTRIGVDYLPKIVSRRFGQLLQFLEKDKAAHERALTVFFCNQGSQHWAEVWLTKEWQDSNSRRNLIKAQEEQRREVRTFEAERKGIIRKYLTAKGLRADTPNFNNLVDALNKFKADDMFHVNGFGQLAKLLKEHKENYGKSE